MILQVLVHIKRVEFLGVETCEEHPDDKQEVERFHLFPAFLHPFVHIVVICPEIVGREPGAEHAVVIVNNGLQLVGIDLCRGKSFVHPRLLVVLVGVGCIGEDRTDFDFGIQFLEYLVVTQQHRHGLNGEQCIVLAVESRFVVVVENELRNFAHPFFIFIISSRIARVIFDQKAQYIFIGNSILD